ncbi:cytochrome P450 [Imleria badia]|nr:cytochrome P450 [Imleria badia]
MAVRVLLEVHLAYSVYQVDHCRKSPPSSRIVPPQQKMSMKWSTSPTQLIVLVPLTVVILDIIRRTFRNRIERKGYPLPPGPSLAAVLWSACFLHPEEPRIRRTKWRAKYGDIMYIPFLGTDVIVLNSTSVALELLEKRSRIYSDRPFISTTVPYGLDFIFAFTRYGEHWRLCRRIFQQSFRPDVSANYHPMQLRKARQLIVNIVDSPEEYPDHFSMNSAALAMSAVYDYEPISRNDPMLSILVNYGQSMSQGLTFKKIALVMFFPWLLHIPDWLPGSWIKREAKEAYTWRDKLVETPYRYVQERMQRKDRINVSMVSDHITRMEKSDGSYSSEYEMALKHASASAFITNVETTKITLMAFTLAMVENPHVWKRAQAEIGAVVGKDRLPEFDDRPSLPYVDAILREVLRWRPALPLGGARTAMQSDIYEGYYIPKGAMILTNVWAISCDDVRYPGGYKFMPERFLDAKGRLTEDDPGDFIFGFGRRKCPGRRMADASLWASMATMLATLDFNLAKDARGNDITFKPTFTGGIISQPNLFPCRLTPRPHISKEMLDRFLSK